MPINPEVPMNNRRLFKYYMEEVSSTRPSFFHPSETSKLLHSGHHPVISFKPPWRPVHLFRLVPSNPLPPPPVRWSHWPRIYQSDKPLISRPVRPPLIPLTRPYWALTPARQRRRLARPPGTRARASPGGSLWSPDIKGAAREAAVTSAAGDLTRGRFRRGSVASCGAETFRRLTGRARNESRRRSKGQKAATAVGATNVRKDATVVISSKLSRF